MVFGFRKSAAASSPDYQDPHSLPDNMPKHVAIIMDGNGRWAEKQKLPRIAGHRKGAETLRNIITVCQEFDIHYVTVYAFSSENWGRPEQEVSDLMALLETYLAKELNTLIDHNIRLHVLGDRSRLSEPLQKQIADAEAKTEHNQTFHLGVCLSYGARQELVHVMQHLAGQVRDGTIQPDDIDEQTISKCLYTSSFPEPDLLIRTGGDQRLSNFLLWQSAYTELYFCETLWPEFTVDDLREACEVYASRERRFGKRHDG